MTRPMPRGARWLAVGLLGVGSLAGCDRLPWGQAQARSAPQPPARPAAAATRPSPPQRPVDPTQVLAEVNGVVITVDEFRRRLEGLAENQRPQTAEETRARLEELIGIELVVQEAKARGLERDPEVAQLLRDSEQFVLYQAALQRALSQVTVTDREVEDHYKQYQAGFKEPERIRLKQIVVKTEPDAKAVLMALLQGGSFDQLARERSVGAGAAQGGDLGYVIRANDKAIADPSGQAAQATAVFPQLEQVAFALEVGGVSGIVKGPEGYYLVKLVERKEGRQRPLNEVWNDLRDWLLELKQREHLIDTVTTLRNQADVTIHEERLEPRR